MLGASSSNASAGLVQVETNGDVIIRGGTNATLGSLELRTL
jgi:hypothetical protein